MEGGTIGQVLQGGEQRPNRMAHLSSFAARRSSGSHPLKTRASRECAELFSPFSSFDCDCQCCSFLFNVIETTFLRASSASKYSHTLASRKAPRGLARLADNAVVQADVARAEAPL